MKLDARIPSGPLAQKWDRHRFELKLVNPANKRKYDVIVVGSGLAGASAAATLAELGYKVKCFCFQDSPRRAHSIAAQGGINAAKNYQNDGDSVYRLFYDTIKGGDFRAREANVYRLAQVSVNIIDQCVAQGVPFAREYGGLLANRSFGGAQVSRTFYARGQTGQQLLARRVPGALPADRPRHSEDVSAHRDARRCRDRWPRQGHRRARSGDRRNHFARGRRGGARDRRLRQRFLPFDQREGLQRHGDLARLQEGRGVRQSVLHADSSDVHSRQRRSSIETHVDVRVAAQRRPRLGAEAKGRHATAATRFRRATAIIFSNGNIRASAISPRATSLPARPRKSATKAAASGRAASACISISRTPSSGWAKTMVRERYGNLFDMYEQITGENAYEAPMRIYPAVHYTMGGLWVDYNLMSNVPGLVRARRSEFLRSRRQPSRRQRADAGTGGRLFRLALHDRQLLRDREAAEAGARRHPEFKKAEEDVDALTQKAACRSKASARSLRSIANSAR